MKPVLIVVGAGGHAAVVADALLAAGVSVTGFVDSDVRKHGQMLVGLPVLGGDDILVRNGVEALLLANGIGGAGKLTDFGRRALIQRQLELRGLRFVSVRHPSAVVSPFTQIAEGSQLFAKCVVQAEATVNEGAIINTAAVVEHGCIIGAYSHVACGAVICGNVTLGARCHVGAGAIIREGVSLGPDTVVGAGAVVLKNFPAGATLLGVPAVNWSAQS